MNVPDLNGIPAKVQKTEDTIKWFIRDVWRGSWFRRLVFLLVIFVVFACPPLVARVFPTFGSLPYSILYAGTAAALLLATIVVGVRTLPRLPPTAAAQIDTRAVRGLLAFNPEDSELFARLERGVELQRVLASLRDPGFRFGILVAPSGAGKTSFLRAGLLPQLRECGISAKYVEFSDEDPLVSIRREGGALGKDVTHCTLLLDQFEQFFLHRRTAESRRPLIDALAGWYQRASGVRVLVSIRAEDVWQMLEMQEHLDYQLSNQNYFKLPKFSLEQAVGVLGVLSEKAGITFDAEFAQKIVDHDLRDSEDGLISPVNLGIIILVLATSRQALSPEGFRAYGGIDGLLEAWLTSQIEAAQYQGLDQAAIRTLTVLCDLDHNRRAGILSVDAVATRLAGALTRNQVERAVGWLASSNVRLALRVEKPDVVGYQLSHERLIPAIRKAAGKLLDAGARANDLLDRRVRAWVDSNRSSRFLLAFFEYSQVERQRPYLIWGERRTDKEALLARSRARLTRRAAALVVGTLILLVAYSAWCTNFVQRRYIAYELEQLAKVYPSYQAARALAAVGNLSAAQAVMSRTGYIDDDYDGFPGKVASEAARTALVRNDQPLLEQALQMAKMPGRYSVEENEKGKDSDLVIAPIAVEMAKTALETNDQDLLRRAMQLVNSLDQGDDQSKALQQIIGAKAKEGLFDQAKMDASDERLKDLRSELLGQIALEMAKAGKFDEAEEVATTLGDTASGVSVQIDLEMASAAAANKDLRLLQRSKHSVDKLELGSRPCVLRRIAVKMAEVGRISNDPKLLERVREEADGMDWKNESLERWKIAAMVGDDGKQREALLTEAYEELGRPQGPSVYDDVMDIPVEMLTLGLRTNDQNLVKDALHQVDTLPYAFRPGALTRMAVELAKVGDVDKSKDLLAQAWQETQKLTATGYIEALTTIAEDTTRLDYLKWGREIAENARGTAAVANTLASIILADLGRPRDTTEREPSRHAKQNECRRDDED